MNTAIEDFTGKLIDTTYQKVIHISDDGYLVNGTGSFINVKVSGSIFGYVNESSFSSFTQSYYVDSASFNNRINNITFDTSSLVATSSFNNFTQSYLSDSSSFDYEIINLKTFTSSYYIDSSSFNDRIENAVNDFGLFTQSYLLDSSSVNNKIDTKLDSSSFNSFTQSYYSDSSSFDSRINNISFDTSSLDFRINQKLDTSSYLIDSSSFDSRINGISFDTSSFIQSSQTSSMTVLSSSYSNVSNSSSYSVTSSYVLAKEKRHDWQPPYDYCGVAPNSSLDSDSVWTITRIIVADDGTCTKTTLYNVKWTERTIIF